VFVFDVLEVYADSGEMLEVELQSIGVMADGPRAVPADF
jgi:hypothetical protein